VLFKHLNQALQQLQLSLFDAEPEPSPAAPVVTPGVVEPSPRPAGSSLRELRLDGQPVAYTLRRARRRSIGFSVSAEGLAVAAPRWVTIAEIERALQAKAGWILRKLVEQREREQRLQAAAVVWGDGCRLPYLGESLTVRLAPELRAATHFDEPARHLHLALPHAADAEQLRAMVQTWLQRQARGHFEQRCRHFAAALDVRYTRLSLSSARTRWGSASASGAIRLNWRLIHFSPEVIDYVVAHELAHLREMNHSARFWAVVGSVLPDYEQARSQLRAELLPRL
jgi:predicted metal-dependent hydrolase